VSGKPGNIREFHFAKFVNTLNCWKTIEKAFHNYCIPYYMPIGRASNQSVYHAAI